MVSGLEGEVSTLRDLPLKKAIRARRLSQKEMREFIHKKIKGQYSEKERKDAERIWAQFGFTQGEEDVWDIVLRVYTEQVGALYDEKEGEILLPQGASDRNTMAMTILAHEVTHALQDQHFDLNSLPLEEKHNDDKVMAIHCLVEGDATLLMNRYYARHISWRALADLVGMLFSPQDEFWKAPAFLREGLAFPYTEGFLFVSELYAAGGWKRVNAAYGDPPVSCEQIMHPVKYIKKRDVPTPVDVTMLRTALGTSWRYLEHNTLGELYTRILLDEFIPGERTSEAAAGWDGDQYIALEEKKSGKLLLVWKSVWDSKKDASEFAAALEKLITKRWPQAKQVKKEPGRKEWREGPRALHLAREGAEVIYADLPRPEVSEILEQVPGLFPGSE